MTNAEYADLVFSKLDYIKTEIIEPNSPGSRVATRYITSRGANEEEWLGYLRDEQGKVDIWLLSIPRIGGIGLENKAMAGTTDKPITVAFDYFYDYRQGYDFDAEANRTNSEREFLTNVLKVDFEMEKRQGCLEGSTYIENWFIETRLKHFTSDTTHWAQGRMNLILSDIRFS